MDELKFIIPLLFIALVSISYAGFGKLISPFPIIPRATLFGVPYSINLRLNNENCCVSIYELLFAEACLL